MTTDLTHEGAELTAKALGLLRAGFPLKPSHQRLIQLVEMPSFPVHASTSWELFEEAGLVRAVWRSDLDYLNLQDPVIRLRHRRFLQPTIEMTVADVDGTFAQATVKQLRGLSIPVFQKAEGIALDGTGYELTVGHFPEGRYKWHGSLPESWDPLRQWAFAWMKVLQALQFHEPTAPE